MVPRQFPVQYVSGELQATQRREHGASKALATLALLRKPCPPLHLARPLRAYSTHKSQFEFQLIFMPVLTGPGSSTPLYAKQAK